MQYNTESYKNDKVIQELESIKGDDSLLVSQLIEEETDLNGETVEQYSVTNISFYENSDGVTQELSTADVVSSYSMNGSYGRADIAILHTFYYYINTTYVTYRGNYCTTKVTDLGTNSLQVSKFIHGISSGTIETGIVNTRVTVNNPNSGTIYTAVHSDSNYYDLSGLFGVLYSGVAVTFSDGITVDEAIYCNPSGTSQ